MQEIEQSIQPELHPGEKLLWCGKPRRRFMFHPASIFLVVMIIFLFALIGGLILLNNMRHFIVVIEHLTSGASARVATTAFVSGLFILLGLVAAWGFVFYPLERRKTLYALTDQRLIIISGLLRRRAKSFDLSTVNFTALTEPVKGKATIIFGQVDPVQYGLTDAVQRQKEIDAWKRFGYRFEAFEVGAPSVTEKRRSPRPVMGRFEHIEDARTVYGVLRGAANIADIKPPNNVIEPVRLGRSDFLPEAIKSPGILTFVVDVSGSMGGAKLDQAKNGMVRALDGMAQNNQVGFLTFSDTIHTNIPVGPLPGNRYDLANAIEGMKAGGGTALYDAIKAGIEMTDLMSGPEDAIRAVVVLTDGHDNRSKTPLDSIITMTSRNDVRIRRRGLAMPTRHPVQIFFIGIGQDADMEIGRMLSQATGAEFQRVTEKTLARVLEEFKYF